MKKRWIISLVCTVFLTTLISLAVRFLKEDDKPNVVVVVPRLDIEYWRIFESGAKKAFDDFDIDGKVIAPDSAYPITNQPDVLKKVLTLNPDALIVALFQPSVAIPVLMEYKKKDIPVLLSDTDAEWEDKTTYIGTDGFTIGKLAGALLGSMLHPGDQVAIIDRTLSDPVMMDRVKGAKKSLEDVGIEIATEQSGYDQFDNPKPVINNILQTYPDIKGVFATTDRLALEALEVIKEKGLNIPVIGTDGITKMLKAVDEGTPSATLSQNPYDVGYLSVEQAKKVIKGKDVQKRIHIGVDIITKDNAKEKLEFLEEISHSRLERFKEFLFGPILD